MFYLADIDSTVLSLCKDAEVPAFLPEQPSESSFEYDANIPLGPDFVSPALQVLDFPYPYLSSAYMIRDVCLSANSTSSEPLRLYLESSQHSRIELSTGAAYSFDQNCFSYYVNNTLTVGPTIPGKTYRPESSWQSIAYSETNGLWYLLAKQGPGTVGPWSMRFTKDFLYKEYDYLWSNGATGPQPMLPAPADTTGYTVELNSDIMHMTLPVQLIPKVPVAVNVQDSFCNGQSVVLYGQSFDFTHTQGTIELGDCDTIVHIDLDFVPYFQSFFKDTLCRGDTAWVNGHAYYSPFSTGVEWLSTADGACDSLINVKIYFRPAPTGTSCAAGMCWRLLYFEGVTYNASHMSGDQVLQTPEGCDSIVHVQIYFIPAIFTNFNPSICPGESIVINGITYDAQNPNGSQYLQSVFGCDSVLNILLNILPEPVSYLQPSLCQGETFDLNGISYDAQNPSGEQHFTAFNGCDSVVHILLSFLPVPETDFSLELCAGESYGLNGIIYDANNPDGTQVLQSVSGCDSVVHISLTFLPVQETDISLELCAGESYG
ncbi:MAG: hypothetical protein IPL65_22445 [Lewinellaceae bacterium]|nr:hypothetical protein [Lewinellaceae bacterium]